MPMMAVPAEPGNPADPIADLTSNATRHLDETLKLIQAIYDAEADGELTLPRSLRARMLTVTVSGGILSCALEERREALYPGPTSVQVGGAMIRAARLNPARGNEIADILDAQRGDSTRDSSPDVAA